MPNPFQPGDRVRIVVDVFYVYRGTVVLPWGDRVHVAYDPDGGPWGVHVGLHPVGTVYPLVDSDSDGETKRIDVEQFDD